MRYKYKLALIMGIMGAISAVIILFIFDYYNHRERESEVIKDIDYTC